MPTITTPRVFNIYIRQAKDMSLEWSYFDKKEPDYWNPVTESSPNLLLKRNDVVNWIAADGIDDIDIILPNTPKLFGPVQGNCGKCPTSIASSTMQGGLVEKYNIKVTIGGKSVIIDPKGSSDQPPD